MVLKKLFLILFSFSVVLSLPAQDSLDRVIKEIHRHKTEIKKLKSTNARLSDNINSMANMLKAKTDSIGMQLAANAANIESASAKFSMEINEANANTEKKAFQLTHSIAAKTRYGIIALLVLTLLSAFIYYLQNKGFRKGKSETEKKITNAGKALQEESILLNTRLSELLEILLKLTNPDNNKEKVDHTLALKVADELARIENNLAAMEAHTKGVRQLTDAVRRIKDNFNAFGYEMPDLLLKPYDQRIKLIVREKIPDDNLNDGEEIITRIIKPQVNYKGIMIQSAQVDIAVG
jgi:hypothetical protein